jgi:hypothetical protein
MRENVEKIRYLIHEDCRWTIQKLAPAGYVLYVVLSTTQTAQHYVQDIASRFEAITHEHPFWAEGWQGQALETRALALNPPGHTTVVTIQYNLRFEGK